PPEGNARGERGPKGCEGEGAPARGGGPPQDRGARRLGRGARLGGGRARQSERGLGPSRRIAPGRRRARRRRGQRADQPRLAQVERARIESERAAGGLEPGNLRAPLQYRVPPRNENNLTNLTISAAAGR